MGRPGVTRGRLTPSSAGLARPAFTPSSGTFDWSLTGPPPGYQKYNVDGLSQWFRQAGRCFRAGQGTGVAVLRCERAMSLKMKVCNHVL